MPERIHKPKVGRSTDKVATEVGEPDTAKAAASGSRLKTEIDDLLDEIDEVLESNAEDFVKSYVQKGGE